MKKYPAYRDSGIDWIGEIPEHWKKIPLKHLVSTKITDGPHETPVLVEEGIPFISAEAVKDGYINFDLRRGNITKEQHEIYAKKCLPQKEDIFMIKSGATTGRIAIVETDRLFNIWSPLALIRCNRAKVSPYYLFFSLNSNYYQIQVQLSWNFGTQQNIGMGMIENLNSVVPPLSEQQSISNYLNIKTHQIDSLIEKKQKMIELLKEERTAIINHAVTKGLNPDVKMKHSGIKWIGEIPEHWDTITIGRLMYLGRGRVLSNIEISDNTGEYPVYSSQTENDGIMGYINTFDFEGDYVTWTTDGANAGTVFFRTGKFNCTNVCGTMKPKNENIFMPYLPYLLNLGTKYHVRYDINPKLMNGVMSQINICVPPPTEQKSNVDYLDLKTHQIDILIEKENKSIVLLQEYRTALISEVVTGKIDVRDEGTA